MALFRRDNTAALKKAEAALTEAQTKITELESNRLRLLQESDALGPVHEIDKAITEQRQAAATYADRVQVLRAALKQERTEQRERERAAALAEVGRRLEEKRVAAARKLEQAIKDMGNAYFGMIDSRAEVMASWPGILPLPLQTDLQDTEIRRETGYALFAASRPNWQAPLGRLPPVSGPPGVVGLEAKGIANAVAAANAAFLAALRMRSAPHDFDEDGDQAA